MRWALEYYAGMILSADDNEDLAGIIQRTYTDTVIEAIRQKEEVLKGHGKTG